MLSMNGMNSIHRSLRHTASLSMSPLGIRPSLSTSARSEMGTFKSFVRPSGVTLSSCSAFRKKNRFVKTHGFFGGGGERSKDTNKDEDIEVKVSEVRVHAGSSIVFLRLSTNGLVLPLYIGESESHSLLKEINKQKGIRPLTHDLAKHLLQAAGYRVIKIRITDLVSSTYYSRVHIARVDRFGRNTDEVEVDSRPSDAINLAVRFDAPMFISKNIAQEAMSYPVSETAQIGQSESQAEVIKSIKEVNQSFIDPTTMWQLQKELAVKEERYADARMFHQMIFEEMMHNPMLRLIVAMETALADGRYEEAAKVRDEYRKLVQGGDLLNFNITSNINSSAPKYNSF